ncbi:MAG: hypothetical protein P1V20_13730 [Verrucomicrobiales bacterium]|nr:hypothetical protein [Verrucomicrobiales bacterium]
MNFFSMKLALLFSLLLIGFSVESNGQGLNPNDEYIIISGGPALIKWESFRRDEHRHDKWWGNFIRTARIRIQQLQKASNNTVNITWLVYKEGYEGREDEDGAPLISNIESVRDKYKVNLVWYNSAQDIFDYINRGKNRRVTKVSGFEYFGHSNKYCFLLDYSNYSLGTSKVFIHQRDLRQIDKGVFAKKAYCKSWGCHSGESFAKEFRRATGKKMIGAVGKTDYADTWKMILPTVSPGGRWTQ